MSRKSYAWTLVLMLSAVGSGEVRRASAAQGGALESYLVAECASTAAQLGDWSVSYGPVVGRNGILSVTFKNEVRSFMVGKTTTWVDVEVNLVNGEIQKVEPRGNEIADIVARATNLLHNRVQSWVATYKNNGSPAIQPPDYAALKDDVFHAPNKVILVRGGSPGSNWFLRPLEGGLVTIQSRDKDWVDWYLDFEGGRGRNQYSDDVIIFQNGSPGSVWKMTDIGNGRVSFESVDKDWKGYYLNFQGGGSNQYRTWVFVSKNSPNNDTGATWILHDQGNGVVRIESADPSYRGWYLDFNGGSKVRRRP